MKKDYQTPATRVVKLQHQCHILAGSAQGEVTATMNSTWEEEEI